MNVECRQEDPWMRSPLSIGDLWNPRYAPRMPAVWKGRHTRTMPSAWNESWFSKALGSVAGRRKNSNLDRGRMPCQRAEGAFRCMEYSPRSLRTEQSWWRCPYNPTAPLGATKFEKVNGQHCFRNVPHNLATSELKRVANVRYFDAPNFLSKIIWSYTSPHPKI